LRKVFGFTGRHLIIFYAVYTKAQPNGVASLYGRTRVTCDKFQSRRKLEMSRGVGIVFLLLALPAGASAQGALNDQQRVGQTLFTQSCGVCHLKPQITANTYGPTLSKESAGGSEDVMRETITNGTPRMPGFKLLFEPTQINAIVAYLKTVPVPQAAPR
jgi:mono/diheme cytochrome c family protein